MQAEESIKNKHIFTQVYQLTLFRNLLPLLKFLHSRKFIIFIDLAGTLSFYWLKGILALDISGNDRGKTLYKQAHFFEIITQK